MNTPIFNLHIQDLFKGIVTAIFAAIIMTLYQMISAPGFDFFAIDWNSVLHATVNTAGVAFFAYISKNLITDSQGKVLGKF